MAGRPLPHPRPLRRATSGCRSSRSCRRAILFVLVFLVGYLLAGMRSGWEDRMIVNGAVAHYGLWKGIRPGLRQNLEEVSARLQSAAASMKTLAADAEKADRR